MHSYGYLFLLQTLTVVQIKKVRVMVDEAISNSNQQLQDIELARSKNLRQIGNILHDSVPVSNDEVQYNALKNILSTFCIDK